MTKQHALQHFSQENRTDSPDLTAKKAWERLPHEPATLFMQFTTYRLMGRKRSLQALVTPSQGTPEAPKSTKKSELSVVKPSVPGNIKAACQKWGWVARAQAWDMHQLRREEAAIEAAMQRGDIAYARRSNRIILLSGSVKALEEVMKSGLTLEEQLKCVKLYAQLLKQIEREMSVYPFAVPMRS